jgi:hypothetical protein
LTFLKKVATIIVSFPLLLLFTNFIIGHNFFRNSSTHQPFRQEVQEDQIELDLESLMTLIGGQIFEFCLIFLFCYQLIHSNYLHKTFKMTKLIVTLFLDIVLCEEVIQLANSTEVFVNPKSFAQVFLNQ